ncbi:MAG: magnesium protoporphyrin IX methyltransferase [Pseudomonadota bacterium]
METTTYSQRRSELEVYFDKTAAKAWQRLTSDAPVGRIRATVRAGRESMRNTLLSWLPDDLTNCRLLDAGCGTGTFSIEAAKRGAEVVAIDLSETLVQLAKENYAQFNGRGSLDFRIGDFLNHELGEFDYIIAMDSLIHYQTKDMVSTLVELSKRTRASILFTYAPKTPALSLMHVVGRFFPSSNRAPAIEPTAKDKLHFQLDSNSELESWSLGRTKRISSGFYTSQALEINKQ